jgi:uncharacterized coiled-coil DUF342 family protein
MSTHKSPINENVRRADQELRHGIDEMYDAMSELLKSEGAHREAYDQINGSIKLFREKWIQVEPQIIQPLKDMANEFFESMERTRQQLQEKLDEGKK